MRDKPPCDLLHQDRPRRAPPGSQQASCEDSEDTRGDPRFAPCWQPPSGTGARLQRPPAPGGGQGPLPTAEEKPRKTKMAPASGSDSTLGQAGRPGRPLGDPSPALGMHAFSLLPPGRHWADMFALLVQQFCSQDSGGHRDRPEPSPSCLPDGRWGGRSSNSKRSNNSYSSLPWARCLPNILLHLHRNPMPQAL